jgi:hypothetical protein
MGAVYGCGFICTNVNSPCFLLPLPQNINLDGNVRLQPVINDVVYFHLLKKMNSAIMIFKSSGKAQQTVV